MIEDKIFPTRQKILVTLTILIGVGLIVAYQWKLIVPEKLSLCILFYSLFVPFFLLATNALSDLNKRRIFLCWLVIGVIHFVFYLLIRNEHYFSYHRSSNFDRFSLVNTFLSENTTSALKTLLIFLLCYKLFNRQFKKANGNYLLSTFRQFSWTHDESKRMISVQEVFYNILLYFIILICVLTR